MIYDPIRYLEVILKYDMNPVETTAYKIGCLYLVLLKETFSEDLTRAMARGFLTGKTDPRKKYLFKCCYKLVREVQHNLKEEEYPLYIRAQLDIIKICSKKYEVIPNISPSCLVGKKAWNRWLVWKKMYDKKLNSKSIPLKDKIDFNKTTNVKFKLDKDYEFLKSKLKEISPDEIERIIENRTLFRWIAVGQVSPYFAILSSKLNKWLVDHKLSLDNAFYIDFNLYSDGVNDDTKNHFLEIFHDC